MCHRRQELVMLYDNKSVEEEQDREGSKQSSHGNNAMLRMLCGSITQDSSFAGHSVASIML